MFENLRQPGTALFLFLTRIFFGIWLTYLGVGKLFVMGMPAFVGYMQTTFAKTWVPELLVQYSTYGIAIGELLIGIWLITGIMPRIAWLLSSVLMFGLMMGQTVLQDHAAVPNIWQYLILSIVCASLNPCPCSKAGCKIQYWRAGFQPAYLFFGRQEACAPAFDIYLWICLNINQNHTLTNLLVLVVFKAIWLDDKSLRLIMLIIGLRLFVVWGGITKSKK